MLQEEEEDGKKWGEKWTVQVGKVFEDGWVTRQIAVLSEWVDV